MGYLYFCFPVSAANDTVAFTAHDYIDGDYILYSKDGGADAVGLTDATNYWINAFDANNITLYRARLADISMPYDQKDRRNDLPVWNRRMHRRRSRLWSQSMILIQNRPGCKTGPELLGLT